MRDAKAPDAPRRPGRTRYRGGSVRSFADLWHSLGATCGDSGGVHVATTIPIHLALDGSHAILDHLDLLMDRIDLGLARFECLYRRRKLLWLLQFATSGHLARPVRARCGCGLHKRENPRLDGVR